MIKLDLDRSWQSPVHLHVRHKRAGDRWSITISQKAQSLGLKLLLKKSSYD